MDYEPRQSQATPANKQYLKQLTPSPADLLQQPPHGIQTPSALLHPSVPKATPSPLQSTLLLTELPQLFETPSLELLAGPLAKEAAIAFWFPYVFSERLTASNSTVSDSASPSSASSRSTDRYNIYCDCLTTVGHDEHSTREELEALATSCTRRTVRTEKPAADLEKVTDWLTLGEWTCVNDKLVWCVTAAAVTSVFPYVQ